MAIELECRLWITTTGTGIRRRRYLNGEVTSFSGDYTDTDMTLFMFYDGINTWYSFTKYAATTGTWTTAQKDVTITSYSIPIQFALVRAADYPNDEYYKTDFDEAKVVARYKSDSEEGYLAPAAVTLDTPTGLSATNITSTGAQLHWNSVENATDYKVEYRRQGDTTWNE